MRKRSTDIAAELRRAIRSAEQRGMTRYQISKASGMPQSQIGRVASGETVPKLDTAARIAATIGYRLELVRR